MTRVRGVRTAVGMSIAVAVTVLVSSASGSSAAPPVPGDTGAGQARSAANDADARVSTLAAQVRRATARLGALTRASDAAQRSVDTQLARQRSDTAALARATSTARTASARYVTAHAAYVEAVAADYEGGDDSVISSAGRLLVSADADQFLVTTQLTAMVARYRAEVTHRDQLALSAAGVATAQVQAALRARQATTSGLQGARVTAQRTQARAAVSLRSLRTDLAAATLDQARTDAVLSHFLGGWSLADPARADAVNRHYLDVERAEATLPMAAGGTHWTAAQGESVVRRALRWIGTPYAWAGGTAGGPTAGRCVAGDAGNDCHVTGFDCSGLALYGWAPYESMPHLASAQYGSAGRLHPTIGALLPGDLVFWSSNGSVGGIHHVAIYVGDGNVLQAPNSGDIVRVTPLGSVSSGYYGATRPRT